MAPDINRRGGSQTATHDTRTGDQQLPAPNASTLMHEDRALGVQQPPEATPGRIFGVGQDGGDTHDLVQPERSRGQSWYSCFVVLTTTNSYGRLG